MSAAAVLAWLKARPGLLRAGAAVAVLAVVFLAGRYSRQKQVEVRTVTVTVEKVVEKRVEVAAKSEDRIVYRDRTVVTKKDGTVVHRDVERHETATAESHTVAQTETKAKETAKAEQKTVTATAPQWKASALLGFDFQAKAPVYGGEVQRRLAGPLWGGVWGLGSATAGVSAGLSLGFEF